MAVDGSVSVEPMRRKEQYGVVSALLGEGEPSRDRMAFMTWASMDESPDKHTASAARRCLTRAGHVSLDRNRVNVCLQNLDFVVEKDGREEMACRKRGIRGIRSFHHSRVPMVPFIVPFSR